MRGQVLIRSGPASQTMHLYAQDHEKQMTNCDWILYARLTTPMFYARSRVHGRRACGVQSQMYRATRRFTADDLKESGQTEPCVENGLRLKLSWLA